MLRGQCLIEGGQGVQQKGQVRFGILQQPDCAEISDACQETDQVQDGEPSARNAKRRSLNDTGFDLLRRW